MSESTLRIRRMGGESLVRATVITQYRCGKCAIG